MAKIEQGGKELSSALWTPTGFQPMNIDDDDDDKLIDPIIGHNIIATI